MKTIKWVPGAIVTPNPITIPAAAPDIFAVLEARIIRLPNALGVATDHLAAAVAAALADHPQADIAGALANHPVHAHDLISQGTAAPPAGGAYGLGAGLNALEDGAVAAAHTVPGAGATGVQNNAAAQAHGNGAAPVGHAAGAGVLAHGAAVNPVVAAVPTRLSTRTISLDVNSQLGDILTLAYLEVGERVLVS